jgi:bifunctional UDP-N-acetylglucosamine pyrophosphorylase/glucosamine-1-phosphate N-acetyltransferase
LTCTRPLAACPVANRPLADAQRERLASAGFSGSDSGALRPGLRLFLKGDVWLSLSLLKTLRRAGRAAIVRDREGYALAWLGDSERPACSATALAADAESLRIRYPWDLLRVNEQLVGALREGRIEGEVSARAAIEGRVRVGKGTRVLPGVFIEGNVVIGRDCRIGPNCYLRGNTSIGDRCRVGQAVEIKNSIVMSGTRICHLSYCGDSIVGENVNLGAGTITANVRHDGAVHRSPVGGRLVNTGRIKFGAVIGDDVHTGIHTGIYPGRKLWPGTWTRPGDIVRRDLRR